MTAERTAEIGTAEVGAASTGGTLTLDHRPGRWIANWDAENKEQWESAGRSIARRNLNWSIFAEFLGFVVWQLWSIVVVQLPAAGFTFSTNEIFWLISMPSLVGATLRIPYTFMVPRFGGRNWTIVSALLLLIPTIGLGLCVANPATPFGVMLFVAALAGFGGGNFASSMANITFFYPAREKGWALGLNAAGGNLGAAVAQLAVPIAITLLAAGTVNLPVAGFMWVPLILLAAFGAWKYMNNLTSAKGDVAGSLAAVKEPHLWIMALLYIGTFGSFIGFAGVFPKLIKDYFPAFSSISVGTVALSLAFLGPLVGSLARPYGGRMADRMGGARMTVAAFAAMAVITLTMLWTLPLKNFWLFLVPVPAPLHRQRLRKRRHLPHDPDHLRHLQPGRPLRGQHAHHPAARVLGPRPDLGHRRLRRIHHPPGPQRLQHRQRLLHLGVLRIRGGLRPDAGGLLVLLHPQRQPKCDGTRLT